MVERNSIVVNAIVSGRTRIDRPIRDCRQILQKKKKHEFTYQSFPQFILSVEPIESFAHVERSASRTISILVSLIRLERNSGSSKYHIYINASFLSDSSDIQQWFNTLFTSSTQSSARCFHHSDSLYCLTVPVRTQNDGTPARRLASLEMSQCREKISRLNIFVNFESTRCFNIMYFRTR